MLIGESDQAFAAICTLNAGDEVVRRGSTRYFLSLGNVFFSLVLGAVALGVAWFHFPAETVQMFKAAGVVREWLASRGWPAHYEAAVRALLDERQIVYMGFVLATRIVVGLIIGLCFSMFRKAVPTEQA